MNPMEEFPSLLRYEYTVDSGAGLNVAHGVTKLRTEFAEHPEMTGIRITGAVYDIRSGAVTWLDD